MRSARSSALIHWPTCPSPPWWRPPRPRGTPSAGPASTASTPSPSPRARRSISSSTDSPPVDAYRRAGVDLDAARDAVSLIRKLAEGASRPEVVGGVGGFAGLFRLDGGRVLAAAADGVGTKVDIARRVGRLDTVGIDLVAMCADDVVCTGAEPLFFLDHIVVDRLVPEEVAQVVAGVAEGCRRARCALLGGETAEHPGHLSRGGFDLAGFCVGVADEGNLLGAHRVREGDALVGLASSGLHANGFSLVRKVIDE